MDKFYTTLSTGWPRWVWPFGDPCVISRIGFSHAPPISPFRLHAEGAIGNSPNRSEIQVFRWVFCSYDNNHIDAGWSDHVSRETPAGPNKGVATAGDSERPKSTSGLGCRSARIHKVMNMVIHRYIHRRIPSNGDKFRGPAGARDSSGLVTVTDGATGRKDNDRPLNNNPAVTNSSPLASAVLRTAGQDGSSGISVSLQGGQ